MAESVYTFKALYDYINTQAAPTRITNQYFKETLLGIALKKSWVSKDFGEVNSTTLARQVMRSAMYEQPDLFKFKQDQDFLRPPDLVDSLVIVHPEADDAKNEKYRDFVNGIDASFVDVPQAPPRAYLSLRLIPDKDPSKEPKEIYTLLVLENGQLRQQAILEKYQFNYIDWGTLHPRYEDDAKNIGLINTVGSPQNALWEIDPHVYFCKEEQEKNYHIRFGLPVQRWNDDPTNHEAGSEILFLEKDKKGLALHWNPQSKYDNNGLKLWNCDISGKYRQLLNAGQTRASIYGLATLTELLTNTIRVDSIFAHPDKAALTIITAGGGFKDAQLAGCAVNNTPIYLMPDSDWHKITKQPIAWIAPGGLFPVIDRKLVSDGNRIYAQIAQNVEPGLLSSLHINRGDAFVVDLMDSVPVDANVAKQLSFDRVTQANEIELNTLLDLLHA